jgi:hypothetical protein
MKIKKGAFHSRVYLPLWFLLLAIWTIFSPRTGIKVLESYAKNEDEIIKRKIDELHNKKPSQ